VDLWAGSVGERFFPEHEVATPQVERITLHVGIASSPFYENRPLRLFVLLSILAARERLWIATPYFVPDEATRSALRDRAEAGVDVRLLLPGEHTDTHLVRLTSRGFYGNLLRAGVRIFEYEPTMMHSKDVVVDGQWSIAGSLNMDIRSQALNEENVLGILDDDFARELDETFLRDLDRSERRSTSRPGRAAGARGP